MNISILCTTISFLHLHDGWFIPMMFLLYPYVSSLHHCISNWMCTSQDFDWFDIHTKSVIKGTYSHIYISLYVSLYFCFFHYVSIAYNVCTIFPYIDQVKINPPAWQSGQNSWSTPTGGARSGLDSWFQVDTLWLFQTV